MALRVVTVLGGDRTTFTLTANEQLSTENRHSYILDVK